MVGTTSTQTEETSAIKIQRWFRHRRDWSSQFFGYAQFNIQSLDKFQGKMLNKETAQAIRNGQSQFIHDALMYGFQYFLEADHKSSVIQIFKSEFDAHFIKIKTGYYLTRPDEFYQQQTALYKEIHDANLSDRMKLFFEFIIGLSRFDLGAQIILKFAEFLYGKDNIILDGVNPQDYQFQLEDSQRMEFFDRLDVVSDISYTLVDKLYLHYSTLNEAYWKEFGDFFSNHKELYDLVQYLCSMHFIPKEKGFLGMAQVLHWQGFGGTGEILKPFKLLEVLLKHAFTYHGNQNNNDHFSKRLTIFSNIRKALMQYVNTVMISALLNSIGQDDTTIHIKDACSGPEYSSVKDIIQQLNESNKKVSLDISDVTGASLVSAFEHKANRQTDLFNIDRIFFEDLSKPLAPSDKQYHLVQFGIGLHQLSDEDITRVIQETVAYVVPGFFICNPDVGTEAHKQLALLPINIVDREGHVPVFSACSLSKLSVSIDDHTVKLAYPLPQISFGHADALRPNLEVGLYIANFYMVIQVSQQDFQSIQKLWDEKNYDACDQYISGHTPFDVVSLQNSIKNGIRNAGNPLPIRVKN